jgi:hypothetical protein
MLEQLVTVQSTFRNKYNKRALTFVCEADMSGCSSAFRGWTSALTKSMEQLVKDSILNMHEEVKNIGYNAAKIGSEIMTTRNQLV